jgi:periplasmic divalent cation tolerance protein
MKLLPRISPPKCWPKTGSLRHAPPRRHLLYYWEGKLEQEYEVQMLLKTNRANQQALLDCLKSHHPYQTPELLVLPVVHGDNDYLSWLNASLR